MTNYRVTYQDTNGSILKYNLNGNASTKRFIDDWHRCEAQKLEFQVVSQSEVFLVQVIILSTRDDQIDIMGAPLTS